MALHGAATTPVGYTTETFKAGQFNIFGLTLHNPVLATGQIDAVSGATLTDDEVDFDAVLTSGTYIMEITSGVLEGGIQDVTVWSGNTITTPQDLSADLVIGDTYQIRAAKTIGEVFGVSNQAGLQQGDVSTADMLWIPNGAGGFKKYYYANAVGILISAGWKNSDTGNTDQSQTPLVYTDGMILERRGGTDLDLVVTGEVKLESTLIAVNQDYTYMGATFPAGVSLGNSGLENYVGHGDVSTADMLWFPDGNGGFVKYYYASPVGILITAGWKNTDTGNTDQSAVELPSGFFIEKRTADFNALISPPTVAP